MVDKVKKVMHEYKHGILHSGSKHGPKVKSRKQAIAIAMSEQRQAEKRANVYLEKIAASAYVKMDLRKNEHPKLSTAYSATMGSLIHGTLGMIPGAAVNSPGLTLAGAGIGALAGGVGYGMRTHKRIKNWNAFVDRLEKAQEKKAASLEQVQKDLKHHETEDVKQEKKTNKYLKKLVSMEEKEQREEKKV